MLSDILQVNFSMNMIESSGKVDLDAKVQIFFAANVNLQKG